MNEVSHDEPTVPLSLLSRALDEVYDLRRLVAYEACVRQADLGYATYPKSRRKVAEERIERLRQAARGDADVAIAGTSHLSLRQGLREAGAKDLLVRRSWENERTCQRFVGQSRDNERCTLPLGHGGPHGAS